MNNPTSSQDTSTHSDKASEPDLDQDLDRRRMLRFGGIAAAVGATAALMHTSEAGAATTTDALRQGVNNVAGIKSTALTSSNSKSSFHVTNTGLGDAIVGDATDADGRSAGVVGTGIDGAGVVGATRGDGPGVRATVLVGARGNAVQAATTEPNNSAATVAATQAGTGPGVYAHIINEINPSGAVFARTVGTGNALLASVENSSTHSAAVKGRTTGVGPGIAGESAEGVGGRFAGKTAQVHLIPSSASTHPASGTSGQLFVDRANRLWFCRGGGDWKQLA